MNGRDWSGTSAPSLDEVANLAQAAFEALPGAFRSLCGELVIQVEDFPDEETLDELGCESPFDLLGLFRGVGLAHGSVTQPSVEPNMVFLYRRPILDYWAEHEETLSAVVTHVLVHEIGHHFGLSDEDMERLEREVDGEALPAQRTVQ
ncbi:MAG: metallopeptidase family protein [Parvibaculaceae bacterium]